MLNPIIQKEELEKVYSLIEKNILIEPNQIYEVTIGYQSGNFRASVMFLPKYNIWCGLFGKREFDKVPRYLLAFGLGRPREKGSNSMIVQINYPIEGISRYLAGMVANDAVGNLFLLHDGAIGGGRPGIGKFKFHELFNGQKLEVSFGQKNEPFAVAGHINSPHFLAQLADFVKQVANIKNATPETFSQFYSTDEKINQIVMHSFSPEFSGEKNYNLPETVTVNADHGIVVNASDCEKNPLPHFAVHQTELSLSHRRPSAPPTRTTWPTAPDKTANNSASSPPRWTRWSPRTTWFG